VLVTQSIVDNFGTLSSRGGALELESPVNNSGTITADNGSVYIDATVNNSGTIEANFGKLYIRNTTLALSSLVEAINSGQINLYSATLTGGPATLTTASAGTVWTFDRGSVFDGSAATLNTAAFVIINDNTALTLRGAINNSGDLQLSGGNTNATDLLIDGNVTLSGGGQITTSGGTQDIITGTSAAATLTNVDNLIEGSVQLGNGELTLINQASGVINGTGGNLVINTGASTITNAGLLEASGGGELDIHGVLNNSGTVAVNNGFVVDYTDANNSGTMTANAGTLYLEGAVSNSGAITAAGGNIIVLGSISGPGSTSISSGTLEFDAPASTNVAFTGYGTLKLANSQSFTGQISGFKAGELMDLADIGFGPGTTLTYTPNNSNTGGTLMVSDGTHTANLSLLGQYMASSFAMSSDGHVGTYITDPPPSLSPMLTSHA
jgi:hypothetical protein